MFNLFQDIIGRGNFPGTSDVFNRVSSNPAISGQSGGGIQPKYVAQASKSLQAENNLKSQGFSDKEVKFLRLQKDKGSDMKTAMDFVMQKRQESKGVLGSDANRSGFLQQTAGMGADIVGGAISEVPSFLGKTAEFASKAGQYTPTALLGTAIQAGFSDKTYGQLREEQKSEGEVFSRVGQKGKELVQSTGLYDPTTTSAKVGEAVTDIAGSVVGPNKVGILKKGANVLKAGKGLVTGAKIGDVALEGALAGAKYDVGTKGKVTPTGVALGAVANTGLQGLAKVGGKLYQGITKKLPASLTLGGLINPAKLDNVKKSLQVDEGVATPQDVGKWILDRVKPGNKQEIADQLVKHAEQTRLAVDDTLATIKGTFKSPTAKKAVMQLRNDLDGVVGMESKVKELDNLLAKGEYTLSELNAIKRELDSTYAIYKQSGEVSANLKAQGLNKIRADIRKTIEDEAEKFGVNIRKLNNETAVARGLADGILRKDSADGVRELLTAFAPSGAGGAIGAGQAIIRGEDPLTIIRDTIIGAVGAKVATSTAIRTRLASAINRLAPKELSALEVYIKSGGKDAVGKKVAERMLQEVKLLPARTITNPRPIVTPQTIDKAVIKESKQGLSSNIKRPNDNTNNFSSNPSNLSSRPKKIQKTSTKVTK